MHTPRIVAALVAATLVHAAESHAACNLIPGTEKTFSAATGSTNRPYAAPGERFELALRPCDASPGFLPTGPEHVVTLAFKPLGGGNVRVVALAANCGAVDLTKRVKFWINSTSFIRLPVCLSLFLIFIWKRGN